MASPTSVPTTASSAASSRMMTRTLALVVPMARRRPISRVRSAIDNVVVLAIPTSAMITVRPSMAKMKFRKSSISLPWDAR